MRIIFHCDINNCFASIEMAMNPALRRIPIAVAGDPAMRRGIVLAKSESAKKCGVSTGDPLWRARQKCPAIRFVTPHFDVYEQYSLNIRRYYSQFTPLVEPYGIDECWLDLTGCIPPDPNSQLQFAHKLRLDIKRLFNITISVGVSFNKVFAKLGSDLKKPDAVTCIDREHFQQQIWHLPVSDLFCVGHSTTLRLRRSGITTIGELARSNRDFIHSMLGKNGLMLWQFANGIDDSPVCPSRPPRQSISHGTTLPEDAASNRELWPIIEHLADHIAFQLQREGFTARCLQIFVRDATLTFHQYQMPLSFGIDSAGSIADYAFMMLTQCYSWCLPVHGIGIRLTQLQNRSEPRQRSLFENRIQAQKNEKNAATDKILRQIQDRFGAHAIERGGRESCIPWNHPPT